LSEGTTAGSLLRVRVADAFLGSYRILKVGWSLFDRRCEQPTTSSSTIRHWAPGNAGMTKRQKPHELARSQRSYPPKPHRSNSSSLPDHEALPRRIGCCL